MLAGHRTHRAGLGAHLTGPASTCETSAARRHRAGRKLDSRSGPRCPTAGHDGLAVGVGLDVMAAAVIAAIDQHVTDARGAHLAEGDFGGVRHDRRNCTLGHCASGQLSVTWLLSWDGRAGYRKHPVIQSPQPSRPRSLLLRPGP